MFQGNVLFLPFHRYRMSKTIIPVMFEIWLLILIQIKRKRVKAIHLVEL